MAKEPAQPVEELSVTMLLADAAQVADGKLSVLGGGIAVVPPTPQPMALAMVVTVPWSRADETIPWVCELLDTDGMPVMAGDVPVLVNGQVVAGRPQGWPEAQPLNVPVVISFNGLPLQPGGSFVWRLAIDGASDERWAISFSVAPEILTA
jgi:hypothetical protein